MSVAFYSANVPRSANDSSSVAQAAMSKVSRRLLPFLFLLYLVCFLDRVNVGFAALQMNRDLGFSPTVYGFGAGIFFIGYALFEVPSNLILARVGARAWIARIMITWGIVASSMLFVRGPLTFFGLRFLLGIAEAGFFPGIIYFLSAWFPAPERARAISRFMIAIPISSVVGGPISGALLGLNGRLGLAGWQWLFLLEGIPAVMLGVLVLIYLPDHPGSVSWLTTPERSWLAGKLQEEREQCERHHPLSVFQALSNATVWQLGLLEFLCIAFGLYVLGLWLPQMIARVSGGSAFFVGVVSAVPNLAAAAALLFVGAHSDRSGERLLHIAVCAAAASIGFFASAWSQSTIIVVLALSLAAAGLHGTMGPFWTLPSAFLTGSAAAGAIALMNSLANLSGFIGPYAIGLLRSSSGNFHTGLLLLALVPLMGAVLALRLRSSPALAPTAHESTSAVTLRALDG